MHARSCGDRDGAPRRGRLRRPERLPIVLPRLVSTVIQLALFGSVSLTGTSGPLVRRAMQHRRKALLAVLASSTPEPLSRDRIVGLLWPESDDRTARHLL